MSYDPEYSTCMCAGDPDGLHGIRWRGRVDPIAVCQDLRDANRICGVLNGEGSWNWIPVDQQLPDDDVEVLVLMQSERIVPAVHEGGHWYPAHKPVGQRLAASAITHWIHPQYPNS